jgi:hypothetical protein
LYFQCGFLWAAVTRMKRPVSPELVSFHRAEQLARLRSSMARITRRDGGRRPCVTGSASLRSRNPAHADHKRG